MIAIIDYGVGNLGSVEKALKFIGADAFVTSDPVKAQSADAVILPGVGAFSDAMENLKKRDMVFAIKNIINEGKPFLGICLGMQLLFDYSEEGGKPTEGLGIFGGAIKAFPRTDRLKVPHMGWNSIKTTDSPIFKGLGENPYVYFVHSYYLEAEKREIVAAECNYSVTFDAAVAKGNVYATQFHPEKSGETGLKILKNWVLQI